jgi:hypothetical protein
MFGLAETGVHCSPAYLQQLVQVCWDICTFNYSFANCIPIYIELHYHLPVICEIIQ